MARFHAGTAGEAMRPDSPGPSDVDLGTAVRDAQDGSEESCRVLLRAVLGLDVAAAARVLGKRPGAVRTAAYRGLRRLAEYLERAGVTDWQGLTLTEVR